MDISKLKQRKKELGFTNNMVAEMSGVPIGTVQKVFGNTTQSPRRETYLALAKVLDPEEALRMEKDSFMVKESTFTYGTSPRKEKKQGEYTIEDYAAWPEDQRIELIDGVIYNMNAPTSIHQLIAGEVYHQIWNCVDEHDVDCFPAISPIDVQLDRDERTMVQPDVIIVRDLEMLTVKRIFGAPEFVLEVLSPSTRSKDQVLKLNKYLNAGCQEYWVVDPEQEHVLVYVFQEENWPKVYTFDDMIPVTVSDGLCKIDFSIIKKKIARFFPKKGNPKKDTGDRD